MISLPDATLRSQSWSCCVLHASSIDYLSRYWYLPQEDIHGSWASLQPSHCPEEFTDRQGNQWLECPIPSHMVSAVHSNSELIQSQSINTWHTSSRLLSKVGRFSTKLHRCTRICTCCARVLCAEFTSCTLVEVHIWIHMHRQDIKRMGIDMGSSGHGKAFPPKGMEYWYGKFGGIFLLIKWVISEKFMGVHQPRPPVRQEESMCLDTKNTYLNTIKMC